MKIRALIVDDEVLACKRIRVLSEDDPDIQIVGECRNGREALAAIQEKSPDLIFLDIQLPDLDGFEVLNQISPDSQPMVIFTTAYPKYALKALSFEAVDYLLKPIDAERFHQALARVKNERRWA